MITSSKSQKCKQWLIKSVFTLHLGTDEQKEELIEEIIDGMSRKDLRNFLKHTNKELSCIYAFNLGKVASLKKKYPELADIDGNASLFKLGYTKNIDTRFGDHMKTYGERIKLFRLTYIPNDTLSQAETTLKQLMRERNIKIKNPEKNEVFSELYLVNADHFKNFSKYLIEIFDLIKGKYARSLENVNNKIKDLYREIEKRDEKIELIKENYEAKLMYANNLHSLEMSNKEKDIKLLQMELKLAKMENQHN